MVAVLNNFAMVLQDGTKTCLNLRNYNQLGSFIVNTHSNHVFSNDEDGLVKLKEIEIKGN